MNKFLITLTVFLFGIFGTVFAQRSIEKLLGSVEQKEGVNLNVVIKRDLRTRKVVKTIKRIEFSRNNGNLYNKFKQAFIRDSEGADEVFNNSSIGSSSYMLKYDAKKERKLFQLNCDGNRIEVIMIIRSSANDMSSADSFFMSEPTSIKNTTNLQDIPLALNFSLFPPMFEVILNR